MQGPQVLREGLSLVVVSRGYSIVALHGLLLLQILQLPSGQESRVAPRLQGSLRGSEPKIATEALPDTDAL